MARPSVLVVSATPLRGSWATSHLMANLFEGWSGDQLTQITLDRPELESEPQPIETLALPLVGQRNPVTVIREIMRARRFVSLADPDVIYFRSSGWPAVFELLPLVLGRPVVTHVMDDWPASLRVQRPRLASVLDRLLAKTLRRSHDRLAISSAMATAFEQRYGVPFQVVHAGTDRHPVASSSAAPNAGERVVLYSGNVATNQSAESLIDLARACAAVQIDSVTVRLLVAPSGELPPGLRDRLTATGATVAAQLPHDEYLTRLTAADEVVATANFDPESIAFLRYSLPNKIPELLASSTPILLYGPPELAYVQQAKAQGWAHVVTDRDHDSLASAITELLTNGSLRDQTTRSAADACAQTFAWSIQRDRFEQVLTPSP